MVESTKKQIGPYVLCLDDKLGEGAFGAVYLGYLKTNPEELYAIKQVNINVSEKELEFLKGLLEREVNVMQTLSHENVIKLIDISITSNNIYLITEICNGGDLDRYKMDLTVEETLTCIKKIVKAMIYANSNNIIHRDLKPANVLVHDGVIKLADFGFARFVEDPKLSNQLTSKKGSPLYMAPEVYFDEKYDAKCDVWSVGVMFYEMIFKKTPWFGISAPDLFINNIKDKPLKFPKDHKVDPLIIDLITHMLQIKPKNRFNFKEVEEHEVFKKKIPEKLKRIKKKQRKI